jgi:hypothetical protein
LKPDVCRRVVGRLPSPGLESRGWRHRSASCSLNRNPKSSKTTVVYLVRSLGLMPESVSHDWHVQPSCQRPNRDPPERREFSPGENARVRIRLSSKPYKHTCSAKSCQSSRPTGFPDVFHKWTVLGRCRRRAALEPEKQVPHRAFRPIRNDKAFGWALTNTRNSMAFRFGQNASFEARFLGSPVRKTKN